MSTLLIVVVAVVAVVLLFLAGGILASRRRAEQRGAGWRLHVADADRALEEARAADRGWDRTALEEAARRALASERPGEHYDELHLVLVDDRPGVREDRAHLMASGADGEARVVLGRGPSGRWTLERIE